MKTRRTSLALGVVIPEQAVNALRVSSLYCVSPLWYLLTLKYWYPIWVHLQNRAETSSSCWHVEKVSVGASEIQILMPWTLKSLLQKQLPTGNEDLRPGLHLAFFTSFYSIIFFFLIYFWCTRNSSWELFWLKLVDTRPFDIVKSTVRFGFSFQTLVKNGSSWL